MAAVFDEKAVARKGECLTLNLNSDEGFMAWLQKLTLFFEDNGLISPKDIRDIKEN